MSQTAISQTAASQSVASPAAARTAGAQPGPAAVQVRPDAGAGTGAAKIAIRGLDFYYGDHKALKGITLYLPERQVTGMIGPPSKIST